MMGVLVISDEQFVQEVLKGEQPVLVYFWAPWCGPCKLVSPSINTIATEYGDRLKVVKMEIDPNPETVRKYRVEGVPALILFKNQEVLFSYEGVITKAELLKLLEPYL